MAKAKKGFNTAATEGASVIDRLASGAKAVPDVKDVQYVQDAKDAIGVNKEGVPLARLNLKIPAELKEYLTVAAAKASIEQRRNISLTQYLCDLVTADMERNKNQ